MSKQGYRLDSVPGLVEWLTQLADHGPMKRHPGRSGAAARDLSLTDFWVKHKPTGRWMHLEKLKEKEKDNPNWDQTCDFGLGKEALTSEGFRVLSERSK